MAFATIEHGETTLHYEPPIAVSPVDDKERQRRAEVAAIDTHDTKIACAKGREIAEGLQTA